jgi:hypothetical protein
MGKVLLIFKEKDNYFWKNKINNAIHWQDKTKIGKK